MRRTFAILAAASLALAAPQLAAKTKMPARPAPIPAAIFTDPLPDKAHPARMEVLHIPSGGVEINGVAYLAAGAGPHPTLVLCHGWPGNEKNLDLAQAVRKAGGTRITAVHAATDHSWSDHRIYLEAQVITWLNSLLAVKRP